MLATISQEPPAELLAPSDRRALARARWIAAARAAAVTVYVGGASAAALAVLKLDVQGPLRLALIWGPILASAGIAGLIFAMLKRLDERERAQAYRAIALGPFGLAGMMMGAAASEMMSPDGGEGVGFVAFIALPALLAWSLLAPLLQRLLRQTDC